MKRTITKYRQMIGLPTWKCSSGSSVVLSPEVDEVLGRTNRLDFENPAKSGVAMAVVGGEDKCRTSSILSADCGFVPSSSPLCSQSLEDLLAPTRTPDLVPQLRLSAGDAFESISIVHTSSERIHSQSSSDSKSNLPHPLVELLCSPDSYVQPHFYSQEMVGADHAVIEQGAFAGNVESGNMN
ncbi:hypothetical protein RHMOL_Rhmol13G0229800 [Rhododendron molle]|uniref:Uncharacterized protein n=1 Tax=Rhododendron molle TaxID=49168 RepID=A0ACC0LB02_RHOML|nr:hypothetical protein RHMOL_Rhmol13G0229800 [Rhododendron molle]